VNLVSRDVARVGFKRSFGGAVIREGVFEANGVSPGSYWALAVRSGRDSSIVGRTPVEVANADVTNVVILIAPPLEVSATALVEDGEGVSLANARLVLEPAATTVAPGANGVIENGVFHLSGVSRDVFRTRLTRLPDGVYLKSIRMAGRDLGNSTLDLNGAAQKTAIELVFSTKAATVSGTVRREGNDRLAGVVVLYPDPYKEEEGAPNPVGVPVAVLESGVFEIRNVPPGNYRLYAFEELDDASAGGGLLKRLESKSVKLQLGEGARERVEAKQIPIEDLEP
jgi:hypothetical protein